MSHNCWLARPMQVVIFSLTISLAPLLNHGKVSGVERVGTATNLAFLSTALKTLQQAACDGEIIQIECPANTIISVHNVQYLPQPSGQTSKTRPGKLKDGPLCAMQASPSSVSNRSDVLNLAPEIDEDVFCSPLDREKLRQSFLRRANTNCRQKNKCSVELTPKSLTFDKETEVGDLCPNHRKLARVAYKCLPEKLTSIVACEKATISLSCTKKDDNHRLAIVSASYGAIANETIKECDATISERNSQHPSMPTTLNKGYCLSSRSLESTIRLCLGHRQCKFTATSEILNNPHCPEGIVRHAKVIYACIPDKAFNEAYLRDPAWERNPSTTNHSSTNESTVVLEHVNFSSSDNKQQSVHIKNLLKQQVVVSRPTSLGNDDEYLSNKNESSTGQGNNTTDNNLINENRLYKIIDSNRMNTTKEQAEVNSDTINNITTTNSAPNSNTRNSKATPPPHMPSEIDNFQMNYSLSDNSSIPSIDMQMDSFSHDDALNQYIARSVEQGNINFHSQQAGQSSSSSSMIDTGQGGLAIPLSEPSSTKYKVVSDSIVTGGRPNNLRDVRKVKDDSWLYTLISDKWSRFCDSIKKDYATVYGNTSLNAIEDNYNSSLKNNTVLQDLYRFPLIVFKLHQEWFIGLISFVVIIMIGRSYRRSHNKSKSNNNNNKSKTESTDDSSKRSTSASESIYLDGHPLVDLNSNNKNKKTINLDKENGLKKKGSSSWFRTNTKNKNGNKHDSIVSDKVNKVRPLSLVDDSSDNSNSLSREYCDQTDDDGFDTSSRTFQHRPKRKESYLKKFNTLRPAMVDMNDYFMPTLVNSDGSSTINNNNSSLHDTNSLATSMTVTSASTYATPVPHCNNNQQQANHTITFCNHQHQHENLNLDNHHHHHHHHHHQAQSQAQHQHQFEAGGINQMHQLHYHQQYGTDNIVPDQCETVQANHMLCHHHLNHPPAQQDNSNTIKRTISNTGFSTGSTTLASRCCSVAIDDDDFTGNSALIYGVGEINSPSIDQYPVLNQIAQDYRAATLALSMAATNCPIVQVDANGALYRTMNVAEMPRSVVHQQLYQPAHQQQHLAGVIEQQGNNDSITGFFVPLQHAADDHYLRPNDNQQQQQQQQQQQVVSLTTGNSLKQE